MQLTSLPATDSVTTRSVTPADLPAIRQWWRERGEGPLPEGILPPCGILATDEDGPAAAAWIYQMHGVPLVMIDWLVSRPGLGPQHARHACRAVFTALAEIAKEQGATRIFATVTRAAMLREAQSCGFHIVARDAVHLIKTI